MNWGYGDLTSKYLWSKYYDERKNSENTVQIPPPELKCVRSPRRVEHLTCIVRFCICELRIDHQSLYCICIVFVFVLHLYCICWAKLHRRSTVILDLYRMSNDFTQWLQRERCSEDVGVPQCTVYSDWKGNAKGSYCNRKRIWLLQIS